MKGKPRNQRLSNAKVRKQQHLMEVTARRDVAASQRNRAIGRFVFRSLFLLLLMAGLWLGGSELLRRYLWENPDYFLAEIRVPAGDGALTKGQIVQASGLEIGKNIFTFDLGKSRAALEELPQVERAEIQRRLPNRIDITVTERRPIAWVAANADEDPTASDKSLLIDARGFVMRTKRLLPEHYHLPVIWGVPLDNLVPGQRVASLEMHAALELLRLNADKSRWQARSVDISKAYGLVVTDSNRARITFGLDDMERQLDRWYRYLDVIEPTEREILTANLMVERNTPFTFADSLATVAAAEPTPGDSAIRPEKDAVENAESSSSKKAGADSSALKSPESMPVKRARPVKRGSSREKSTAESVRKPFRP